MSDTPSVGVRGFRRTGRTARRRADRRQRRDRRPSMAIERFEPRIAFALTPALVADINLQPASGNPGLSPDIEHNGATLITQANQPIQIFTANDGQHGLELWASDGTTGGTQMLKDIWPGATGSAPTELYAAGSTVYFTAGDPVHGRELWKTDGTAAGTVLVKDIVQPVPGGLSFLTSSDPADFAALPDGTVLFSAQSPDQTIPVGRALWRTDGTAAGTVPVLATGLGDSGPTGMTACGDRVLFRADDGVGNPVLWVTDGTAANTVMVQTTTFRSIVDPRLFTVFDGPLVTSPFVIFTADDGAGGRSLWRYDATNGLGFVAQFGVTAGSGTISEMVRFGDLAVFAGDNGDGAGPRLWRTTGANGGTVPFQVYSSPSFRPVTNPAHLTRASSRFFFTADGLPGETSLWTSNGTDFGTFRLGSSLVGVENLVARGGEVGDVFFVNDDGTSKELWKSDGSTLGIVREINPTGDAFPNGMLNAVVVNDEILFAADDGIHGTELWKSDGTAAGTALLRDINPETRDGIDAFSDGSGSYLSAAVIGGTLYFAADDGVHGTELWKRDGDSAPVLVADLEPGAAGARPAQFTVVGNSLYFTTSVLDTTSVLNANKSTKYSLWVLDVSSAAIPVRLNSDVTSSTFTNELVPQSHFLMPLGTTLIFSAADGVNGTELWVTGGTLATTQLLKNIDATAGEGSFPSDFAAVGSSVVFAASDGVHGRELWITDGTAGNTKLLKDIFPGGDPAFPNSSYPSALTTVGGVVYFSADDGVNGVEPWVTDGTPAGTRLLKNINTNTAPVNEGAFFIPTGSAPAGFTALGSWVLFMADDGAHGMELWRTDGTAAGTALVKDINPTHNPSPGFGPGSSGPGKLTALGGKLYFGADDGTNGRGLWMTDGTGAGTVAVPLGGLVDATPDVGNLVTAGGKLFFTAEKNSQRVLLQTDGTSAGSSVIELGAGYPTGFDGYNAVALAGNGRRFYFGVDDGVRGRELWQLDFPAPPAVNVVAVGTDGRATTWNREFSYALVNPTTIRIAGLSAIQSGFFSANVPVTITPAGGLTTAAAKVVSGRYDARTRSVLVTLSSAIPTNPKTGTLMVGQSVQPGARLIDTGTGEVVRAISSEELEAAGYSAAFATRFQGGLRVSSADVDGNGYGDMAVAPGGVPDQADLTQPGRKLAAIFTGSASRVAIFDGTPTPSWQPVSIDVGNVFGADGAGGYLVALGDVRADATGSGVRELVVAAGRKVAVFDVLVATPGARPTISPVPVQVMTLAAGQTITSVAVGRMLSGSFEQIIVASNTAKGAAAGTTTVSLLDGTSPGTLRSFVVSASVESGPSRNLVDIFAFGAQVAAGDFDGNAANDLVLGAGANGLGNFRVIGGEFLASPLWFTDRAGYQAAITQQLGDKAVFSQVRPLTGNKWRPLVGPDFFSPLVPMEPLGNGFNAPVSVAAVPDGNGKAKLFAALGATNQTANTVKRFVFAGSVDRWVNDASFDMKPETPGRPQMRAGIGLRLG